MHPLCFRISSCRLRCAGMRVFQAAALALLATVVIPAKAADDRAIKSRVPPTYPEIARRMKITGIVKVEVTIDPDGTVTDVKTISGSRVLSPAAEDAVRKWRFAPAAAQSTVTVEITFSL
jgi:TonB family protein